jgi:two-component system, sensor histidine kinase and response regulator
VVDDNATNRCILRHYVSTWQMRPETVPSGLEALETLQLAAEAGEPFDLVLLDFKMPTMDGLAVAAAMKLRPELRATKVVMLSSLDRRFTRAELEAHGLAEVLTKPVRQPELLFALQRVLPRVGLSLAPVTARVAEAAVLGGEAEDLRVLVAEDNAVNLRVMLMQLQKLGCQADVASNGWEVLAAADRERYDVVLMDCQMPEMDGYEASRRLRSRPGGERLHIIAITAHAMEGDREKCLAAGMDDYVTKPVSVADLTAALQRSALRAEPMNSQLPTSNSQLPTS